MCGICGTINRDPDAPVDEGMLHRMAKALAHRGPDSEGFFANGHVGLAHRRLAIIDLSSDGAQPMSNEDGSIWIVFNGEIYNFYELREALVRKGHNFRSRTDTEVIVHLYEELGPEALRALRGMFALAIWDANQQQLLLARDRLGKKPLFYFAGSSSFAFASELQSLLEDTAVPRVPDLEAIRYYLTYRYVPSPYSAFQGIRKLPPAHYLLLKEGQLRTHRYWALRYAEKSDEPEEVLVDRLRGSLEEAVRLRMIGDVPIGAFLSGGLDSSAVVALMSRWSGRPVKTFSIGFEEDSFSELPYARSVARRFGTDHHEYVVKPDAVGILPLLVRHFGEPFADSTAVPQYYLSQLAREHVTVVLAGDGGDEAFGGYDRYVAGLAARPTDRIPITLRNGLAGMTRRLSKVPLSTPLLQRTGRMLRALSDDPQRRYVRWMSHFDMQQQAALFSSAFLKQVRDIDPERLVLDRYQETDAAHPLDATLDVDVNTYLPDDLLVKVDITSMANSLEVRAPLLDHPLMEFAAALPPSFKIQGVDKKYLLKRAMVDLLPAEILNRSKQGFIVPIDRWFRHDLQEMAYDTLLSSRSLRRGYFRPEAVKRLLDEHAGGAHDRHRQLWSLLMLELWHRCFIDQ
ncbi:asparagine synthase (glutamine-hydrolyzing) [Candidatus Methylomirabilis sp.]|uniref:asparagine synthase (glutamine-hydrolyzing) n=1 Tax=Candidatus Methylomirabilis sp. TaxID=2032687 RepID=UPI003076773C